MRSRRLTGVVAACCLLALSARTSAQSATTGALAGTVKDTTGAVLPGVTVEASSPALIEKVRSATTDAGGLYKIVELRPGTYSVTFTLPGFTTIRREGVVLNAGVTLPASADLQVGSVSETVTVSGASPVVDVQNVRSQRTLSQEILETLPIARTPQGYATLTLGVSTGTRTGSSGSTTIRDVGGNQPDGYFGFSVHGAPADGKLTVDGVPTHNVMGDGTIRQFQLNQLAIEEVALETSGMSAESPTGGVQIKVISKDGGNRFSLNVIGSYTGHSLESKNLNDALVARGLTQTNQTTKIYDIGAALGGPVKKDRLWFFAAARWWDTERLLAGIYYNKTPATLFYAPDLTRPADPYNRFRDVTLRGTWQAAAKDKVTGWVKWGRQVDFITGVSAIRTPEGTYTPFVSPVAQQVTWTHPATSRLLFDAGMQRMTIGLVNHPIGDLIPGALSNRAILEQATGLNYGSAMAGGISAAGGATPPWIGDYGNHGLPISFSTRFAVSYVTGTHAFKTGIMDVWGTSQSGGEPLYTERYEFRNGLPVSLTEVAAPNWEITKLKADVGVYASDQWTLRRMTLNLGLRFDYLNAIVPEQIRPGGFYLPPTRIAPVDDVPNWKDITPRLGAAYDLFGNGKTAIKGALGKYVVIESTAIAIANSGSAALTVATNRTWNDANGDYVPNCDLKNIEANGECGAISNRAFGTPVITTRYDPSYTKGWGVRPYDWQASGTVQHELRPGVSVTGGYFHTWYGNFTAIDNLAVVPSDFSPYCVTAPTDARLPGSGQQLCGLYDINPDKFGLVNNLVTKASNFGKQRKYYDGLELSANARFGRGGTLFGGVSTGRTVSDNCFAVDSPQQVRPGFCRAIVPMGAQTQVKVAGAYPLPWWGLQTSATLQNLPGLDNSATRTYASAEIAPSLGRTLGQCRGAATCTGTATIALIQPNSVRESRQTQVDIRFTKVLRIGSTRLIGNLDVYNLFNEADVLSIVTTFGPTWLRPGTVLAGRLVKVGGQVTF